MSYEELKKEFTRESFREEMIRTLGRTCGNCGCENNIEYHHIVPLKIGGTNRLSNIVPLCHKCHVAAHTGRNVKNIKDATEKTGRPKKWKLTASREEILWKWATGKIGTDQLRILLGMGKRVHIKKTDMYIEFINKHGICDIKNIYDMTDKKLACRKRCKTSTIFFDGHVEEFDAMVGTDVLNEPFLVKASGSDDFMLIENGRRYRTRRL